MFCAAGREWDASFRLIVFCLPKKMAGTPSPSCLVLLILLPLLTLVCAKYYIDTGYQHVLQTFDTGQKEELEDQILDVLGLHHRPKPQASRSAAPKLLLDLYQTVLDEEPNGVRVDGELLPQRIQSAIQEADTIVSFADQKHGTSFLTSPSQHESETRRHTCVCRTSAHSSQPFLCPYPVMDPPDVIILRLTPASP